MSHVPYSCLPRRAGRVRIRDYVSVTHAWCKAVGGVLNLVYTMYTQSFRILSGTGTFFCRLFCLVHTCYIANLVYYLGLVYTWYPGY
jgi:hypothetical protein